jgi:hypothetical protein
VDRAPRRFEGSKNFYRVIVFEISMLGLAILANALFISTRPD